MDWEESDAGYELRSLHITVINMLNTDILTEIIIFRHECLLISAYPRSTGMPSRTRRRYLCWKRGKSFPKLGVIIGILQKAARLDKRA